MNQQPSKQPLIKFASQISGRQISNKSFIFWCPEGDLNPHGG
jgi:hypothetical protein